jgi:hypothetical protein
VTSTNATTRRHCCVALGGLLGALLVGCGGERPAPKAPSEPVLEALRLRPISELVVGAGLRWLVLAEPREVLGNVALEPALSRLVPPVRRAVFEKVTAIELAALDHVVVAGYDESTLFVLDGVTDPLEAEKRFRERLLHDVIRKSYRPDAIWTHGRTATGKLRAMSALSPGVVAIEGGGSLRAKVALLFAIGRLHRSPRALSLPDMNLVLEGLGDAPIRALALGPFAGDWDAALQGMLAVCTVVGGSIRLGDEGQLDVSIRLAGGWGDDAARAAETLRAGWRNLEQSSLGRLLQLDEPIDGPRVEGRGELVGLDVRVDGVKLLDGLYDLVAADIGEILAMGRTET